MKKTEELMRLAAEALDMIFNPGVKKNSKKKYGWALIVYKFNDPGGKSNYISNAERESMIKSLRAQADVLESRQTDQDKEAN